MEADAGGVVKFDITQACVVLSILCGLLLTVMHGIARRQSRNLPPGPTGLPIIGVAHLFINRDYRVVVSEMRKMYGDIFSVRFMGQLMIMVNGYDCLQEFFVKNSKMSSDRHRNKLIHLGKGQDDTGISMASGEKWKRNRGVATNALRNLGMGKRQSETIIKGEISHLFDAFDKYGGVPFDPKHLIDCTGSNIANFLTFGRRYEYDDLKFCEFLRRGEEVSSLSNTNVPFKFPWVRHLPGDPFGARKILEYMKFNELYVQREMDRHKQDYKPGEIRDVIDAYFDKFGLTNEDTEIRRSVIHLILGATDTTSATIRWFLINMLRHPEVMTTAQKEIDEMVPSHRMPEMGDRSSLPYINAVIMETQRMGDIAPFSLPHKSQPMFKFRGFDIPEDAYIFPNLNSIHHDPDIYPNPLEFDPNRFLDEDGKLKKNQQHIPFSLGKRACPGESLARAELFLLFAAIVQRYDIKMADGESVWSTGRQQGILYAPNRFLARFINRENRDATKTSI